MVILKNFKSIQLYATYCILLNYLFLLKQTFLFNFYFSHLLIFFFSENRTIVIDDPDNKADNPKSHHLKKRSVHLYDSNDIEGTCDVITNTANLTSEDGPRPRRNAEWSNINRLSNVSYVKVLIVADRTMVKYHVTQDDLTYYILTIMGHVRTAIYIFNNLKF